MRSKMIASPVAREGWTRYYLTWDFASNNYIPFHVAILHCTIVRLNIDLDLQTEKKRLVDS